MNSTTQKVLNPKTNRFVNVGSQKHKRLIAEGVFHPPVVAAPAVAAPAVAAPAEQPELKDKLEETLTDIVKDNSKQFAPELTQAQTDRLLKALLYEKLCVSSKTTKKTVSTRKTAKKKKFKVVQPSSESESESESD